MSSLLGVVTVCLAILAATHLRRSSQPPGPIRTAVAATARVAHPQSTPGYVVLDFTPAGPTTAWAMTRSNRIRHELQSIERTTDGGRHWRNVTPPGLAVARRSTDIETVFFSGSSRGWLVYGPPTGAQTLLRTSDGGRTWARAGRLLMACQPQFVDPRHGWCVESNGAAGSEFVSISRTTDGGRTWRTVSDNSPDGHHATTDPIPFGCDKTVTFTTRSVGFASSVCAGGEGFVYTSTDGGARWHRSLEPAGPTSNDGSAFTTVAAAGPAVAVGQTINGYRTTAASTTVFRSADGGAHWTAAHPPGRSHVYTVDLVTPRRWRLARGRTILTTDDCGRSWSQISSDTALGTAGTLTFTTATVGWDFVQAATYALRTEDGGRHWTRVEVPQ